MRISDYNKNADRHTVVYLPGSSLMPTYLKVIIAANEVKKALANGAMTLPPPGQTQYASDDRGMTSAYISGDIEARVPVSSVDKLELWGAGLTLFEIARIKQPSKPTNITRRTGGGLKIQSKVKAKV